MLNVTFGQVVKNKGNKRSPGVKLAYFLNKDSASYLDSAKIRELDVPPLDPGQSSPDLVYTHTLLSSAPAGQYYFSYKI